MTTGSRAFHFLPTAESAEAVPTSRHRAIERMHCQQRRLLPKDFILLEFLRREQPLGGVCKAPHLEAVVVEHTV
jgi:hypothetical protein